jgi:hypothetical protein
MSNSGVDDIHTYIYPIIIISPVYEKHIVDSPYGIPIGAPYTVLYTGIMARLYIMFLWNWRKDRRIRKIGRWII